MKFEDLNIGDIFVSEEGSIAQKIASFGGQNALIIAPPTSKGSWVTAGNTTFWNGDSEVSKATSLTVESTKIVVAKERRSFS